LKEEGKRRERDEGLPEYRKTPQKHRTSPQTPQNDGNDNE